MITIVITDITMVKVRTTTLPTIDMCGEDSTITIIGDMIAKVYDPGNFPNVRYSVCSICSVSGHYEQHYLKVIYQIPGLSHAFWC